MSTALRNGIYTPMNNQKYGIAFLFVGLLLVLLPRLAAATDPDLSQTDEIQWQATTADPAPGDVLKEATALKTPVKIYEYLRNNAEFAVYQGSRSGSVNTLDGLRGNDVDLASALIAMYRSQGIPARYAVGTIQLDATRLENWLGVTNFSLAKMLLENIGADKSGNIAVSSNSVEFEHVWVEVLVPYGDYRGTGKDLSVNCGTTPSACHWISLDPSFKQKAYPSNPIDIYGNVSFDYGAYYDAIKDDNKALLNKNPLTIYEDDIQSYLEANDPGKTLQDVVDTGTIIPDNSGILPASLPYQVVGTIRTYNSVDEHDAAVATGVEDVKWAKYLSGTITLNNGTSSSPIPITPAPIKLATLTTEPLTVSYDNLAQDEVVQLGGQQIATLFGVGSGKAAQIGDPFTLNLSMDVDATDNHGTVSVPAYPNLKVGGYYLIGTGGDVSNWSQVHRAARQLLTANKQYPIVYNSSEAGCNTTTGQGCTPYIGTGSWSSSDQKLIDNPTAMNALTGGLLYVAMEQYYAQFHDDLSKIDAIDHVVSPIEGFVGVVSSTYGVQYINGTAYSVQPAGLLIDMKGQDLLAMWRTNAQDTLATDAFTLMGHTGSALENETWQELTGYDAVSTVRGIQIALATPGASAVLDDLNHAGTYNSKTLAYPYTSQYPWYKPKSLQSAYGDFGFQLGSPPAPFTEQNLLNYGANGVSTNQATFNGNTNGQAFDIFKQAVDSSTGTLRSAEHKYIYKTSDWTAGNGVHYGIGMLCVYNTEAQIQQYGSSYGWSSPVQFTDGYTFCSGNTWPNGYSTTFSGWRDAVRNDYTYGVIPFVGTDFVHFFDEDQGFNPAQYAYRLDPPSKNFIDTSVIKKIRDTLDTENTAKGWYEYEIPNLQAVAGGEKFDIYLSLFHDATLGTITSESYIIQPANGLPAGGGYVDSSSALNLWSVLPSTEAPPNTTPVFSNPEFTNKQPVALTNNDRIRTTSTNDPVSTDTGNNFHNETDFTIRGRGLNYVFTRTYNSTPSATKKDGPLGHGWTDSYNVYLQSNDYGACPNCVPGTGTGKSPDNGDNITSSITFYDERGGAHTYLEDGESGTYAVTDPMGDFSKLTLDDPVAGEYTLTFRNGTKYIFQDPTYSSSSDLKQVPGKKARLITIEDPYGNQLNFTYDSATGNLTNVVDNLGISGRTGITFTYYTGTPHIHTVSDWTGRTWTYAYDTSGNLISVTNALGDITTYGYAPGTHNLTGITLPETNDTVNNQPVTRTFSYYQNGKTFQYADGLGNTTSLDYDLFRQQTRVTDPLGNVKAFDYSTTTGGLLKLTEPDGAILDFTNDPTTGLRTSKTNGLGYKTQYTYDGHGNVTQETDPAPTSGAQTPTVVTTYGPNDQVASVKDRNGVTTTTQFYSSTGGCGVANKPESVTISSLDGVANVKLRTYCWNANGTLDYVTDYLNPTGTQYRNTIFVYSSGKSLNVSDIWKIGSDTTYYIHTHYTYDSLGRITSKTLYRRTSASDATALALTTSYTYDALDHVTSVTDPLGNITKTVYDKNGKIYQIIKRYLNADGTTYTDRTVSTREYDAADRLISNTDVNGKTTTYSYDADGRLITKTDPMGNVTHYKYDAMGRRTVVEDGDGHTVTTTYDLAGHPIAVTNPDGQTTKTSYDALGRAVSVTDPKGYQTLMSYDANGNMTCLVDANAQAGRQPKNSQGCSVSKTYDEMNRVTSVVDALGDTTHYTYDLLGNRTSVEDANGHTTTFVYNAFGKLIKVLDPLSATTGKDTTYTYDEAGNLLTKTDRKGQTTTYTYDKLNRLIKATYADGTSDTYHFDEFGDRDAVANDVVTYDFQYNDKHQLIKKTDRRDGTSRSLDWTYDAANDIQTKTNYGGSVTTYLYDGTHRLVGLRNPHYLQVSYQYDPAGRLLNRILSSGAHTDYTYDADGFLSTLDNETATGNTVDNVTYTRDRLGHILTATDGSGTTTYTYDALYRLTSAVYPSTEGSEGFDYDAVGNRLHYIKNGVTLYHYFYDADNRLTKIENNSTGAILQAFVYDADGNMITRCSGGTVTGTSTSCTGQKVIHYKWDARNRLTSVSGLQGTDTYQYDPFKYRIETVDSRGVMHDYLEGEHLEARYASGGQLAASYFRGVATDEIVNGYLYDGAGKGTNVTFHHDALTNVVGLSSADGKVLETTQYGAFGDELADDLNAVFPTNDLKYTGRAASPDTGLYYYRARYYDPSLGRFISEDPTGFGGGINFYVYAGDDPVDANDPTGKFFGFDNLGGAIISAGVDLVAQYAEARSAGRAFHWNWKRTAAAAGAGFLTDGVSSLVARGAELAKFGTAASVTARVLGNAGAGAAGNIAYAGAENAFNGQDFSLSSAAWKGALFGIAGSGLSEGAQAYSIASRQGAWDSLSVAEQNLRLHIANATSDVSALDSPLTITPSRFSAAFGQQFSRTLGSFSGFGISSTGGNVPYPNSSNTNMLQSVYQKGG